MKRLRAMLPLLLLLTTGIVLLAGGMGSYLAPGRLAQEHAALLEAVQQHPWLSRLAYIGLLTLVTSTGIPGSLLVIIAGGLVFGEIQGTLLSSIGLLLGSLLLFLASRYAFGCGRKPAPRVVERLRHGYAQHPVNYTFFLRFVPVFPFGAVTVGLAWLRCPMWLFLLSSFVGGSIMLIFETAIGADLGRNLAAGEAMGWRLFLDPHMLLPLGALALLAVLPVVIRRRQARNGERKSGQD
ncbi:MULTISPECIES: VTT domain-containing protein [Oleiagrimonas]|uniref:TVP38/TMEM64 family membrane protein n=1 Tax=Oleiagrimonas citrea TaxID=1665687 RepID=A0A846ZQ74_9GAMM|nr:VTT domain-containing protein [Oleiagrimonas sp. MCCC 1A03011]NKZ39583.1 TVP38/TMEM64 family protein [Oleiagrimonas citrea]RAP59452.1 TVP38/TMEM64 family protein [Oleiagrimonas sp. MCCC 1A03011]